MFVKLPNPPASGLRVPGMHPDDRESGIDVPDSGVVNVKRQTGEALLEQIDGATEHDGGDDE